MIAWLKRLFRIGSAEAHSTLDSLENPIKMTEQGIRELKGNLEKGLVAMAEVKALAIRSRGDHDTYNEKAKDYESKALALLKKAKAGELDQNEADRLASEALLRKVENTKLADNAKINAEKFEAHVDTLNVNLDSLKANIAKYENELKTLKARAKVSEATAAINKDLAGIDSSSTVSMLERMKDKVSEQEALSESYAEIAHEGRSLDQEIDDALEGGDAEIKMKSELDALKEQI
jgi:phage shock protein A